MVTVGGGGVQGLQPHWVRRGSARGDPEGLEAFIRLCELGVRPSGCRCRGLGRKQSCERLSEAITITSTQTVSAGFQLSVCIA